MALALIVLVALTACGSDEEPAEPPAPESVAESAPEPAAAATPEPAEPPAPEPVAAPEPEPTPEPAVTEPEPTEPPAPEPAEAPQPVGSLEDFIITPATTGQDLLDRLSETETSCIRETMGEGVYQIIRATPLLLAGGDAASAAPLFNCLTVESVVILGLAFNSAQAGGWSAETRRCMIEVGLEHPEAVYVRLGLEWQGPETSNPAETLDYNVQIYDCMSDQEKMDFTLNYWRALDRHAGATGTDIVALLSESEAACVGEGLSEDQFAAVLDASPLEAVAIGSAVSHCITPETNIAIFVSGIQWALGDLSDESVACVEDFAKENPAYVNLLSSGLKDVSAMTPAEFLAIADIGTESYDCMTAEELWRVQENATAALAGS
ncbi:MAG: hypothetical protein OXG19_06445 [Chloroflexi bacterium]|nr:hypothetical protein [Chloroflexota bacterium]